MISCDRRRLGRTANGAVVDLVFERVSGVYVGKAGAMFRLDASYLTKQQ